MIEYISITQIKSSIGRLPKHKATLTGLGLRYIGHTVKRENTPSIQGMIKKLSYMLKVF
ncbi:50S ribosomal protein L30 [Buchnera aphidicola (Schlechtendalia chinensis)]|uniref:Large ribosomal subunit protein uL30 n=1 Tax=Buchnera aphidicola subsp. Schlechtendalia chinensis TaxID=118110 RepID=A0A172WE04_BUCSC|nr:50S ribosomal protein L30 [Buchnera aphidicola]ANF17208.1 50S ribosomal protein L30 [Buchnera aphidicola (Schlechtendalia chinensis)]